MAAPSSEHVVGRPHPALRPFVTEYRGYRLAGFPPGEHAGLPSQSLTLIAAFDEPLDMRTGPGGTEGDRYWGMLAGLHHRPAVVHHEGRQHGVQVAVTPRGAAALFGVPAGELGSIAVHLAALDPTVAAG